MSTRYRHRIFAAFSLAALFVLGGCNNKNDASSSTQTVAQNAQSTKVLRVGYQKSDSMNLLRIRGDLEKRLKPQGVQVEFVGFPAGPQMLEAIGVGSLDLGSTGDAPVIFAQSAGLPIVYVANNPPGSGSARAIIVPKDSPIRSVADLRGKKIAIQKGSGTHNFLVQTLQKAKVPYSSIKPVYLAPPDAQSTLR